MGSLFIDLCTHDAARSISFDLCRCWFGRQSDEYMAFLVGWPCPSGTVTRQRLFCVTALVFSRMRPMNSKLCYVPNPCQQTKPRNPRAPFPHGAREPCPAAK